MRFFTRVKSAGAKEKYQTSSMQTSKHGAQPTNVSMYQPLLKDGSIRLFVLFPGAQNSPISGSFTTSNLHAPSTQYEALSYVWGSSNMLKKTITIDGRSIAIGDNLFSGLQYFRYPTKKRVLWIDALCINQEDEVEKRAQLAIMHEVYMNAANVVIWLGNATKDTAVGIEVLRYLAGNGELLDSTTPWRRSTPRVVKAGLNDLMGSKYWRRVWVIQEFVLAPRITLQCGQHTISWNSGHEAASLLARVKFAEVSPEWRAAGLRECDLSQLVAVLEEQVARSQPRSHEMSLLDVVYKNRKRTGKDPRDAVLAVLPLASEGSRKTMAGVGYETSVEEIWRTFLDIVRSENPEVTGSSL